MVEAFPYSLAVGRIRHRQSAMTTVIDLGVTLWLDLRRWFGFAVLGLVSAEKPFGGLSLRSESALRNWAYSASIRSIRFE